MNKIKNLLFLFPVIVIILSGVGIWRFKKALPEISRPEVSNESEKGGPDVLNAVSSIKKLKDPSTGSASNAADASQLVDPNRIGMWGHSMGGNITLRAMVVTKDIKAGVIWAGVVASYEDMMKNWRRSRPWVPPPAGGQTLRRPGRQQLIDQYGDFDKNPQFWNSIAPISFVADISGPVQIHHGTADGVVPLLFSVRLSDALKTSGKTVELFTYEGDVHNLSRNLLGALQLSVGFFDRFLKN